MKFPICWCQTSLYSACEERGEIADTGSASIDSSPLVEGRRARPVEGCWDSSLFLRGCIIGTEFESLPTEGLHIEKYVGIKTSKIVKISLWGCIATLNHSLWSYKSLNSVIDYAIKKYFTKISFADNFFLGPDIKNLRHGFGNTLMKCRRTKNQINISNH